MDGAVKTVNCGSLRASMSFHPLTNCPLVSKPKLSWQIYWKLQKDTFYMQMKTMNRSFIHKKWVLWGPVLTMSFCGWSQGSHLPSPFPGTETGWREFNSFAWITYLENRQVGFEHSLSGSQLFNPQLLRIYWLGRCLLWGLESRMRNYIIKSNWV